ncbi:MAG: NAD(P)/FAD-dependent oxidoreductase [Alphaproteobacteria bacterium]
MAHTADVAIIGAGIQGCSTALHCAQRGLSVIVLEKDHAGRHASGVNAGGVRRLNRHPAEIPLSVASMRIWHGIEDLLGDDCGFHVTGQIRVAETPDDLAILEARASQVHDLGFTHEEIIGREELYDLVPALAPHCVGALIARDDGFASPAQTTGAFAKRAAELGVVFLEGCRAEPPRRHGNAWQVPTAAGVVHANTVVNSAGAWGGAIAAALGEPVPIEPVAPMLMITDRLPHFLTPVVGSASRYISFKQLPNGTVLIGGGKLGTTDPARNIARLDLPGLATLAKTAHSLFPIMQQTRVVRCWAGIEGYLRDGIPVIGPSMTEPNLYHAFGFSLHGFQLGPVIGKILAELIAEGRSTLPIAPFSIARFAANDQNAGLKEAS